MPNYTYLIVGGGMTADAAEVDSRLETVADWKEPYRGGGLLPA